MCEQKPSIRKRNTLHRTYASKVREIGQDFDKEGRISKSLVLTFERGEGGGEHGGMLAPGMTVEMEIKTKDIVALMKGLEQAKMANVKF